MRLPSTDWHPNSRVAHGWRTQTRGVVIHTTEGPPGSAENWFKEPGARGEGAHVIVGKTKVTQIADLNAVCFHASGANHAFIGFEHEGYASNSKRQWLTRDNRRLLRASANRVAWVCYRYQLGRPRHKRNVFGHRDFPRGGHVDPGRGWPWFFYMALCRRAYRNLVRSDGRTWL